MSTFLTAALFGAAAMLWLKFESAKHPSHWINKQNRFWRPVAYFTHCLIWIFIALIILTVGPILLVAFVLYALFKVQESSPRQ